jgi:hypothetical protein
MTPIQDIYRGLSFDRYKEIDALNMSLFKELAESPGKLDHRRRNPKEVTAAMLHGSAIGCLALEPELFDLEYAVKPEGLKLNTKIGKAWAAEHAAGKAIVPNTVRGAATAVLENELARALIAAAEVEVTLVWKQEALLPDGTFVPVWCKGRDDLYIPEMPPSLVELLRAKCGDVDPAELPAPGDPYVLDLKSTGKRVDRKSVSGLAYDRNWWRQAPWYLDGSTIITGRVHNHTAHIVVEQEPPHRVEVYPMPLDILKRGREKNRAELDKYAYCRHVGKWPSSSGKLQVMEWPRWAK